MTNSFLLVLEDIAEPSPLDDDPLRAVVVVVGGVDAPFPSPLSDRALLLKWDDDVVVVVFVLLKDFGDVVVYDDTLSSNGNGGICRGGTLGLLRLSELSPVLGRLLLPVASSTCPCPCPPPPPRDFLLMLTLSSSSTTVSKGSYRSRDASSLSTAPCDVPSSSSASSFGCSSASS
mmetsp:Transcript_26349/g.43176  ORF Transcript_26349/g.43176 Transcript_26349/m.43176 type:complete len:175 (-) Transcript_26349:497-1021(-)